MRHLKLYEQFNEDHNQINIPFKEPGYKNNTVHEDLLDAIQDLTVKNYGTYKSTKDVNTAVDEAAADALKEIIDDGDDEVTRTSYLTNFAADYPPKENKDLYDKATIKLVKNDEDDYNDPYKFAETAWRYKLEDLFTKKGLAEYKEKAEEIFNEDLDDMLSAVGYEKGGEGSHKLIDIWRTVAYTKGKSKDLYSNIVKNYGGVGVYWTWDEKSAQAYWGDSSGHSITLHAQVSVDNVDWPETLTKNAGSLRDEKEIRIKDTGAVLLAGFHDDEIEKYYPFDEPIVVRVGKVFR
jgi:hypothetical protein